MKDERYCPRCGRTLIKSELAEESVDGANGYAFQCLCCDEDFFLFETLEENRLPEPLH